MSDAARERFKAAAEAVIREHRRNIGDRGITGPGSALHVGRSAADPGLLDVLADAAEQAFGEGGPARRGRRGGEGT